MSAIVLHELERRFGKVPALNKLSLTVNAGEVYGFLGRNGAGKTTTLRILMGILEPDAGHVELLGERVTRVGPKHKQRIGYVSQEPTFYPWMTAGDLGRFVGGLYPTWDAPEFARLLKLLDVPTDRRAAEMSGGTRAKLGLALALAPRPPLLLLDEPTAGLDPVARREFNDLLVQLQRERGTTVFFSSHLVGEVEEISHRVGIIHAGRARFEGDVQTLLASVKRVVEPPPPPPAQPDDPLAAPSPRPSPLLGERESGFEVLRENIVRATPEQWAAAQWPEGTRIETLSLEDIFLAFARVDARSPPR